jgi:hypothetical protein
MAKETIIVVHPFGDYHAEIEPAVAQFTAFTPWSELTIEERARVLGSQAAHDYMLTDERFVQEAGTPEYWDEYSTSDFEHGELEPIGLGKLVSSACEGNSNYTDFMNPVFRRISKE